MKLDVADVITCYDEARSIVLYINEQDIIRFNAVKDQCSLYALIYDGIINIVSLSHENRILDVCTFSGTFFVTWKINSM